MPTLSSGDRKSHLQELHSTKWDVLVIGGGITGAGIALEAASRGLKVALVEKMDFAWGTSSRSTKLIHGGLRYLKQLEFALVREVGLERAIVHKNARHIVRPEQMLLPFYENGSIGKLSGSLGLWLYDRIAQVDKKERRKILSRKETLNLEPLLNPNGLTGGGLYYEYRTDDARLTIEVLKTAGRMGAMPINYCEVRDLLTVDDLVRGAVCKDVLGGDQFEIKAGAVINATGPWVDSVRKMEGNVPDNKVFLSNGLHIVVRGETLPINRSMYFDADSDGRMIFTVVREGHVYIGTTDVEYRGDIDHPRATDAEMRYLLDAVNSRFKGVMLTKDDVVSTWSGLRPLIYQEGKEPSEMSRKDEIFISRSGLVSIAGGKLTGYRRMAERAVDAAVQTSGLPDTPGNTADVQLTGCTVDSEARLFDQKGQILSKGMDVGLPEKTLDKWFWRYGSETDKIINIWLELREYEKSPSPLAAELDYARQFEMVHTPEDFLLRRTSMSHFGTVNTSQAQEEVTAFLEKAASVGRS